MARPAAFMRRVHERFGDPVTIRTYWTEEPMVLFSHPDAVREIFRLDPAIAPAGQLRPHSDCTSSESGASPYSGESAKMDRWSEA